jgi:hypothetical protein
MSKQPQPLRAFGRAGAEELAQRPAGGVGLGPVGGRHRAFAVPVAGIRGKALARATAARRRAIAPKAEQRALHLRQMPMPVAVGEPAPLRERHPARKPPIASADLSSHNVSFLLHPPSAQRSHPPSPPGGGRSPHEVRRLGVTARNARCDSRRRRSPHPVALLPQRADPPPPGEGEREIVLAARVRVRVMRTTKPRPKLLLEFASGK